MHVEIIKISTHSLHKEEGKTRKSHPKCKPLLKKLDKFFEFYIDEIQSCYKNSLTLTRDMMKVKMTQWILDVLQRIIGDTQGSVITCRNNNVAGEVCTDDSSCIVDVRL